MVEVFILIPVLQIREQRYRVVKYLAHGFASIKMQSQDLNLVSLLNLHFFVLEQFI